MKYKNLIRVIITLTLLSYLLIKINISTLYSVFIKINFTLLLLTTPFIGIMYAIRTKKWQILLDSINVKIPFLEAFEIVLVSTFYGALTPGRVGELSRSFYLKEKKAKTVATIIVDRIVDVVCLLFLSILFVFLFFYNIYLISLIGLMVVLSIAGIMVVTNEKIISFLLGIFRQSEEVTNDYLMAIKSIAENKKMLFFVFIFSLGYYMINLCVYWLILKAINPMLNSLIVFSLPIIVLLSNIPISISGLGVREFVSVTIFNMLNESSAYGFSFSLILYVLTILTPGIAGVLWHCKKNINKKRRR